MLWLPDTKKLDVAPDTEGAARKRKRGGGVWRAHQRSAVQCSTPTGRVCRYGDSYWADVGPWRRVNGRGRNLRSNGIEVRRDDLRHRHPGQVVDDFQSNISTRGNTANFSKLAPAVTQGR